MDDRLLVPEHDIPRFLKELVTHYPYMDALLEEEAIEKFKESFEFSVEMGGFLFTKSELADWLEKMKLSLVNKAVWELVHEGQLEVLWDAELNDFVFAKKGYSKDLEKDDD